MQEYNCAGTSHTHRVQKDPQVVPHLRDSFSSQIIIDLEQSLSKVFVNKERVGFQKENQKTELIFGVR